MSYSLKVIKDYPIGFWPLDESSGTTASDISGCGNNATYVGSPAANMLPIIPGGGSGTKITNIAYITVLQIEDVNIWEVIYEQGGGVGIYASWDPYAEFYMIRVGWFLEQQGYGAEVYYGPGAMDNMMKRAKELGIPISTNKVWVEPEEMWLYKEA